MYFFFNRYISAKALCIWSSDLALLIISAFLAVSFASIILPVQGNSSSLHLEPNMAIFLALSNLIAFYYFDLFKPKLYRVSRQMMLKLAQAVLCASLILTLIYCTIYSFTLLCSGAILANALILPLFLVSWRTAFAKWFKIEFPEKRVLILGTGELAKKIGREIYDEEHKAHTLVGFIDDAPPKQSVSIVNPGVIGGYGDIANIVAEKNIDKIIVAFPDRRAKLPMSALLRCKMKGITIIEGATFHERFTGKIPLNQLRPSWLVFCDGFKSLNSRKLLKRFLDVIASIVLLIIATPVMAVTALLIKLESKGPILFSQARVGEGGKEFNIYKFRSMREDAEKKTGPVWAISNDDRITRVGKIIRKTRIDELPQLINIVKGNMSFVGPRPERPFFVDQLKEIIPYYELRSTLKPGITGWAQVRYPYGASPEDALEKLQFDMYYIKNMNILFDLMIIFSTVKVILARIGSR